MNARYATNGGRLVWAVLMLLLAASARAQTTWYVDDDALNDPGPGDPTVSDPLEDGSPEHPFDAIQEGIDASVDGDTVLVLDGTYIGDGNKNLHFDAKAITVRSDNGPENSIIDCENDGRGFTFHWSGETDSSIVDGFTITKGNLSDGDGGAISCRAASPAITNCTITENQAFARGGGVFCYDASAPLISNCTIAANVAASGGAVFCSNGSNPTFISCTVEQNMAERDDGGAVFCASSDPEFAECIIAENLASRCGGGFCLVHSNPTIVSSTVLANTANQRGGGVYCDEYSNPAITNCSIEDNTSYHGGGLFFTQSNATIANCVIAGNAAGNQGGGVCCYPNSSPQISYSLMHANTALQGAAVFCAESSIWISHCRIHGNTATSGGGGLYATGGSAVTVDNCIITRNSGSGGGGMACYLSSAAVTNCIIGGNNAVSSGGGVWCSWSDGSIDGCTIAGNRATSGGGGILCWGEGPVISNCAITGNTGEDGAGINHVGFSTARPLMITNCLLNGGIADGNGGGIVFGGGNASVTNSTIVGNAAANGGGVYSDFEATAAVANCILRGNQATMGQQISLGRSLHPSRLGVSYSNSEGGVEAVYVEDGCTLDWGDGNIDADAVFVGGASGMWSTNGLYDPNTCEITLTDDEAAWYENELAGRFVNPDATQRVQFVISANSATSITVWADRATIDAGVSWIASGMSYQIHDYRLLAGSPCIDAGDNMVVPEGIETDLDGNSRFVDDSGMPDDGSPPGGGPFVDMGAYEFQGETCFADLDADGDIDLVDLAILLANYGSTGTVYGDGDLDRDEDVDLADLATLLAVYGTTCP
jgi:hypothetical protein